MTTSSPSGSKIRADLPPPLFTDGERVLCFHGPLIYEGKVLKIEYKDKDGCYNCLIHYAGWSKSWDEFVPETRVLKWTPENLQRQKEHKMAHEDTIRSAKKAVNAKTPTTNPSSHKKKASIAGDSTTSSANVSTTDSRPASPTTQIDQKLPKLLFKGATGVNPITLASIAAGSGATPTTSGVTAKTVGEVDGEIPTKKRKRGENIEPEQTYMVKQEVQISLPEQLKIFLVDDWDSICRQKKLVNIPSRHTVDSVLKTYMTTKKEGDIYSTEICDGIKEYFNSMLGNQLLYRFERFQYSDVLNDLKQNGKVDTPMTSVYGPVHLLRLFTKLGTCLSYTTLEVDAIDILKKALNDFFQFLLEHYDDYFTLEDYGVSAPEYQRKAPA